MADHPVVSAAGTVVSETAIQDFAADLRGEVLRPGDAYYDATRRVFNAMIDRRPALIVRCAGESDVMWGVTFARTHELPLAVRGGGHGVAGKAVCDGGVMLDLSRMTGARVDAARRTARAQAGLTLGALDRATQAFGLATPLGVVSMTGIAGLTLGGGLGWLNGAYGLACDNVLAAEVVTADGRLLAASAEEHADLYWGIRGGSGNFGVVTTFEYRLHPVGPVLAGRLRYPLDQAREVLRFYHEFSSACPDELSTGASLVTGPDGAPVVSIGVCYCGDLGEGERLVRPLRALGRPLADGIQPMAYCALQSGSDANWPSGQQHYWKASYLRNLSDDAIEVLIRFVARKPSPTSAISLQQLHGVAARVAPDATAFPHRDQHYDCEILASWDDPGAAAANIAWARDCFEAMQPYLERGVYVNGLGDEGEDRTRAAYGTNYERLAALKATYDPTNLFRNNQNIRPAVA